MSSVESTESTEFTDLFLLRVFRLVEESRRYLSPRPPEDVWDSSGEESIQSDFEIFLDVYHDAHMKWEKEIILRIEQVFGTTRNKLEEKHGREKRLSRMHSPRADENSKCEIMFRLFAITIPDFGYDSRITAIMDVLRFIMEIPRERYIKEVERHMAEQIKKGYLKEKQDLEAQSSKQGKLKKKLLIGIGAVTGAVALSLTAGLAAPVVLPVFASLVGAAFLTSATATTIFVVVFGVGGAGLAGYKMERRYQNISSFHFRPIVSTEQMRVALGVSGWIEKDEDLFDPWIGLAIPGVDLFVLEVEKEAFKSLGSALQTLITKSAVGYAAAGVLKATALSAAVSALSWPVTIVKAGSLIDNPWSVCVNIAEKAGLVLAEAIRKRAHGHRPVCSLRILINNLI